MIFDRACLMQYNTANLTRFVEYVHVLTKHNLTDKAIVAEKGFMDLLNQIYNLHLINANDEKNNAQAIDLLDATENIIVQVSVSCGFKKIYKTFRQLGGLQPLYNHYRLLFFFISLNAEELRNRKYGVTPKFIKFEPKGETAFNKKSDIIDVATLIAEINSCQSDQLEEIVRLTSKLFDAYPFFSQNNDYKTKKKQQEKIIYDLIEIEKLIDQIGDNDFLKERRCELFHKRQTIEKELFQDVQGILDLAQYIAESQNAQLTERMRQAMDAFENGNISKARDILGDAESYVKALCDVSDLVQTSIFRGVEELRMKIKTIMADTSDSIEHRVDESLSLWKKIYDIVIKYHCEDYSEEMYENLLEDYSSFLKQFAHFKDSLIIQSNLLDFRIKKKGSNVADTATSYNNIGRLYYNMGEYSKALEYYEKALKIREQIFGSEHPYTAKSYNNIGLVHYGMGAYSRALEYYEKALRIKELVLGRKDPSTAISYNNIGQVYDGLGDYPKALDFYETSLRIREQVLGMEHPDTAQTYNNIGAVYYHMADYSKALECNMKALEIYEKSLGADHTATATTCNNIGCLYYKMEDMPKALEFFEKSIRVFEISLGPEHQNTKISKKWIARVKEHIA